MQNKNKYPKLETALLIATAAAIVILNYILS